MGRPEEERVASFRLRTCMSPTRRAVDGEGRKVAKAKRNGGRSALCVLTSCIPDVKPVSWSAASQHEPRLLPRLWPARGVVAVLEACPRRQEVDHRSLHRQHGGDFGQRGVHIASHCVCEARAY